MSKNCKDLATQEVSRRASLHILQDRFFHVFLFFLETRIESPKLLCVSVSAQQVSVLKVSAHKVSANKVSKNDNLGQQYSAQKVSAQNVSTYKVSFSLKLSVLETFWGENFLSRIRAFRMEYHSLFTIAKIKRNALPYN